MASANRKVLSAPSRAVREKLSGIAESIIKLSE
jgi:hypothetical protein